MTITIEVTLKDAYYYVSKEHQPIFLKAEKIAGAKITKMAGNYVSIQKGTEKPAYYEIGWQAFADGKLYAEGTGDKSHVSAATIKKCHTDLLKRQAAWKAKQPKA